MIEEKQPTRENTKLLLPIDILTSIFLSKELNRSFIDINGDHLGVLLEQYA